MPTHLKVIQVFVASPGEMAEERKRLAGAVNRLNNQLTESTGIRFELQEWRQVAPGMGRPEDVILERLPVEMWDVFIGLLWVRFGMPPGRSSAGEEHASGTEEEFRLAYRAWQERQRPRILWYRCTRPAPLVSLDTEQLRRVQDFFDEFASKGKNPGLFQDFGEADQFERMVEKHLTHLLIEEYRTSSLPPRMRGAKEDVRSSRGHEPQTSGDPSLLTPVATKRRNGDYGWRNPFIVGAPILDPAYFFGREREISFCLARLRGMQSVSITGKGRIGKSSLLRYLTATVQERLGPQYRTVYVDLLSSKVCTLPGLLGEILHQLGVDQPAASLTVFEQLIGELRGRGTYPVVALDELEIFVRLTSEFSQEFCEMLRSLGSAKKLALLTASRISLSEMHTRGALVSPLYNIMGNQPLRPFTDKEAREFVTAPRPGVHFSEVEVAEILRRGEGHPLRLQVLCFHAAQARQEHRDDWVEVWAEAATEAATMLAPTRNTAGEAQT